LYLPLAEVLSMSRLKCFFVGASLILTCRFAAGQSSNADLLKQRIEREKQGKAIAEANEPSDADKAAGLIRLLASADDQVRADAVGKLRVLARRVDRIGGQRVQRGELTEPKVPGLLPEFIKASHDSAENVRIAAAYALADTLDPLSVPPLRDMLADKNDRVRLAAACLLTEFHDASGLPELKNAVRRFQTSDDVLRYMDGEKVLVSLERITTKSFGPVPMNPLLLSDSRKFAPTKQQYQDLFDAWVQWWDWTPPAKP
jgi:HEAT repeats